MYIEQIIIAGSTSLGVAFICRCVQGKGRRLILLLSAFGLFAVAGYEGYMFGVWERTVHAAIRLDIFLLDFPIMFISTLAGVLAWARKPPRSPEEN